MVSINFTSFGKQNWHGGMNQILSAKVCVKICFWLLTASKTSEVKNDHVLVIRQDICNKLIEIKCSLGCMVWAQLAVLSEVTLTCVIDNVQDTNLMLGSKTKSQTV